MNAYTLRLQSCTLAIMPQGLLQRKKNKKKNREIDERNNVHRVKKRKQKEKYKTHTKKNPSKQKRTAEEIRDNRGFYGISTIVGYSMPNPLYT